MRDLMSTEKSLSPRVVTFLLITIVLSCSCSPVYAEFCTSANAADRNPLLDPSFPSIIGALVFFFAGMFVSSGLAQPLYLVRAKVCKSIWCYIGTVKDEGLVGQPTTPRPFLTNVGDLFSRRRYPSVNVCTPPSFHSCSHAERRRPHKSTTAWVNPIEIAEVVVYT